VATANSGVVTRVVDEGHETKYYRIIKNIIEYSFARNKKLKIVFFDCDWFDTNRGTRENQFGMVEVKHADRLSGCDYTPLVMLVIMKIKWRMERLMMFTKMMNCRLQLI
jgi:hypothetical protein